MVSLPFDLQQARNGRGTGGSADSPQDCAHVLLDGLDSDADRPGDLGVGAAIDQVQCDLALPDGTTSFYAASPSGIDVEIGAGGNVLGERIAGPLQGTETSSWGHALRLRAKLRVAGALALQRLGL